MIGAQVKEVSFAYGGRRVLDGVSFEVLPGEMLGVVGPNGSGKTTLIGLMSGLLRPLGGEVAVDGKAVARYGRRELSRIVAVVPQTFELVFPYTVEEVVAMGRYSRLGWGGWPGAADREACARAMELTDTARFGGRTMGHLSAGERQRVLLARALAQEPSLLLLDEASSFLDIGQERALFEVLDGLRRDEGLTILTVSHDLNLVGAFCRHVVLLKEGRVRGSGEARGHYTSANLSELFGTPVRTEEREEGGIRVSW